MSRIFYGNFDFEHELASRSYARSSRLSRLNAELTCHLLALAEDGDALLFPDQLPLAFLEEAAKCGMPHVRAFNLNQLSWRACRATAVHRPPR